MGSHNRLKVPDRLQNAVLDVFLPFAEVKTQHMMESLPEQYASVDRPLQLGSIATRLSVEVLSDTTTK